jgi:MscS family membrane protein
MLQAFETMMFGVLPEPFSTKYIIAAIIFLVFLIASKAFVFIVERIVLAVTAKTKTKLDDMLVERTNKPMSWLLIFIGLRIALEYLDMQNVLSDVIYRGNNSLIYIGVGVVISAVLVTMIDHWGTKVAKKTKSTIDDALIPLFRKTVKFIVFIMIAIMVLDLWGINVAGILAGVGIAGLALGFAVKDSLANIFGGISLIIDKTFNVGDKVELDDGTVGVVKDVGVRATRIKTYDNEVIVIPNGFLANSRIKNHHLPDMQARVKIDFTIAYGEDPEKAKKVVLEEIKNIKDVLKDPKPFVKLNDMGDFSLNMSAFFWVDDLSKKFPKKEEATYKIYKLLSKKRIDIPFPTQTVYVKKGK